MVTHTRYFGEDQSSADSAGDALDQYYASYGVQDVGLGDAIAEGNGYSALRWITAKAIANARNAAANESRPLQVGDRVENVLNPSLDHRSVIGVIGDSILLDFQQDEIDHGELPSLLPMDRYRRVQ